MNLNEQVAEKIMDRFMAKVQKTDGCWNWTGTKQGKGYGLFYFDKETNLAHRASYLIHFGNIPDGLCVLHHCDNRLCVNPEHIYLGTPKDNSNDMKKRGRSLKGEKNHQSKLTNSDVYEIRELSLSGIPQSKIADNFGIVQTTVSQIVNRKRWKHLEPRSTS